MLFPGSAFGEGLGVHPGNVPVHLADCNIHVLLT